MDIVRRIEENFPELAKAMREVPAEFSPDWLKQSAIAETGLSDLGPETYAEPLERLCESLNTDADLNAYGRMALAGVIRNQLANRLLLQRERKERPERLRTELVPPIIVTGL